MNILVCVKYVPDAQAARTFNESDNTTDREGVDGLLSELDEYAVEQALRLTESNDGEVTVLTVGPAPAADAVKKALQMGADKGIHVQDDAIKGSDAPATSLILAEAIRKLSPELVIFGMASTDGTMGVVPAMVAERLDMPQVTMASELTFSDSKVTIRRDNDAASQTVEATMPVILSVTDQSTDGEAPRYPSFKGIMAAKKKPVDTWALSDLGVDAGQVGLDNAWTSVVSFAERPPREQGEVVTDEGEGGKKLAEFLSARKFI